MGNDTNQEQLTPLLRQLNFWCECMGNQKAYMEIFI